MMARRGTDRTVKNLQNKHFAALVKHYQLFASFDEREACSQQSLQISTLMLNDRLFPVTDYIRPGGAVHYITFIISITPALRSVGTVHLHLG